MKGGVYRMLTMENATKGWMEVPLNIIEIEET